MLVQIGFLLTVPAQADRVIMTSNIHNYLPDGMQAKINSIFQKAKEEKLEILELKYQYLIKATASHYRELSSLILIATTDSVKLLIPILHSIIMIRIN